MISQKKLNELVNAGHFSLKPEFRRPTCANCGRVLWFRMWHIFLKEYGNKREIHLCKNCGEKYNVKYKK